MLFSRGGIRVRADGLRFHLRHASKPAGTRAAAHKPPAVGLLYAVLNCRICTDALHRWRGNDGPGFVARLPARLAGALRD